MPTFTPLVLLYPVLMLPHETFWAYRIGICQLIFSSMLYHNYLDNEAFADYDNFAINFLNLYSLFRRFPESFMLAVGLYHWGDQPKRVIHILNAIMVLYSGKVSLWGWFFTFAHFGVIMYNWFRCDSKWPEPVRLAWHSVVAGYLYQGGMFVN